MEGGGVNIWSETITEVTLAYLLEMSWENVLFSCWSAGLCFVEFRNFSIINLTRYGCRFQGISVTLTASVVFLTGFSKFETNHYSCDVCMQQSSASHVASSFYNEQSHYSPPPVLHLDLTHKVFILEGEIHLFPYYFHVITTNYFFYYRGTGFVFIFYDWRDHMLPQWTMKTIVTPSKIVAQWI